MLANHDRTFFAWLEVLGEYQYTPSEKLIVNVQHHVISDPFVCLPYLASPRVGREKFRMEAAHRIVLKTLPNSLGRSKEGIWTRHSMFAFRTPSAFRKVRHQLEQKRLVTHMLGLLNKRLNVRFQLSNTASLSIRDLFFCSETLVDQPLGFDRFGFFWPEMVQEGRDRFG